MFLNGWSTTPYIRRISGRISHLNDLPRAHQVHHAGFFFVFDFFIFSPIPGFPPFYFFSPRFFPFLSLSPVFLDRRVEAICSRPSCEID